MKYFGVPLDWTMKKIKRGDKVAWNGKQYVVVDVQYEDITIKELDLNIYEIVTKEDLI